MLPLIIFISIIPLCFTFSLSEPLTLLTPRRQHNPFSPRKQVTVPAGTITTTSVVTSTSVFLLQREENAADNGYSPESLSQRPLSIGFIGCGLIASSIATGLATQTTLPIQQLLVSRRSTQRSSALALQFPRIVSICDDNQEILNSCSIIFLCVLPKQTAAVLQNLTWDSKRHVLISLVATATLEDLCRESKLPAERVFKMICLPSVARCNGVSPLLTPSSSSSSSQQSVVATPTTVPAGDETWIIPKQICQVLGGCVQVTTMEQMSACMVVYGLMGSFYGILRNNVKFLMEHGQLPVQDASYLVGTIYDNMIQDVVTRKLPELLQQSTPGEATIYDELIEEQTAGGLNEQALKNLESLGVMEAYDRVQTALLSRIRGESDGSL